MITFVCWKVYVTMCQPAFYNGMCYDYVNMYTIYLRHTFYTLKSSASYTWVRLKGKVIFGLI